MHTWYPDNSDIVLEVLPPSWNPPRFRVIKRGRDKRTAIEIYNKNILLNTRPNRTDEQRQDDRAQDKRQNT